jgi:hypothetical protein
MNPPRQPTLGAAGDKGEDEEDDEAEAKEEAP